MNTPKYKATVVVGGEDQSIQFDALPDSLINRQSGDITIIHNDADKLPFDISSLSGSDFKCVPVGSGQTPVTLAVGVVGFTTEIFTLTTSSTAPTSGTFILRVAGEDTAAIAFNADAATVQSALEALPSRTGGDFLVSLDSKENLSFAGAKILIETSGGFAIDFESTLDSSALLPVDSIKLKVTQKGSNIANEYNATWDKDLIPAEYSQFDFDQRGAIAFFIALEDGDDFYQVYQLLNIVDDTFALNGDTIPTNATFVYNPNDPNAWLRITPSSPGSLNEGLDKLVTSNRRHFGTVLSLLADPPVSPSDGDAHLVIAPATGAFFEKEDKIAKWSSTLAAWAFTNEHRDGDEILNLADDLLYRVDDLLAWVALPPSDMDTSIYDPALITEQLVGLTATQALTNKDINGVTLTAAGSATNFLNEAGGYTVAGEGDVVGPGTVVNDRIVLFNGTTGKLIDDSGYKISNVLNRGSHTGTQLASTISDFDTAAAKVKKKTESGTTYTLTDADIGYIIYFDNVAGCTVDLDTGRIDEFSVSLIQDTSTSTITIAGTATLKAGSDLTTSVDNDAMIILPRPTTDEYTVKV